MSELDVMYINGIAHYKVSNGTGSTYKPIPKQFKPYFDRLQQENQQLKGSLKTYEILLKANDIGKLTKERDLYKSVIDEVRECLESNRNSYIYQDGLGDDWYFQDLDVFDELDKILDKVGDK